MKIVFSPEAVERLEGHVRYIRDAHAPAAADRLRERVLVFIENFLAVYPRTGRKLEQYDLWEIWIPKTKLLLWYQIEGGEVVIISVWHAAQDREGTEQGDM